jgi:hypothetical protein
MPVLGDPVVNEPPAASFQVGLRGLTLDVRSTSTDPDGAISSVQWAFGDGRTATGVQARHVYAKAGRYQVTMTVTDDEGASRSTAQAVTARQVATRTSLTAGARQVRRGRPLRLSVAVRPTVAVPVTGTVRIVDKGRVIRTVTLRGAPAGPRTMRVVLRGLSVGRHRLRVVYSGSPSVSGSRSDGVVVRVVRR